MLKYHEVYRIESREPLLQYFALTGAAPINDGRWIFWRWRNGAQTASEISFKILKQVDLENDVVGAVILLGDMRVAAKFVPVTVEYMIENPNIYGIPASFIPTLKRPGIREVFFSMDIAETYNQEYEPAADDLAERYATDAAAPQSLKLESGEFLEKQADGTWKKLDWFP